MRTTITSFVMCLLLCTSFTLQAQLNTPRGSQMASVMQRIGTTDVTITYSRPSVNGREIWGKLVPYGLNNLGFGTSKAAPWRAGANENTILTVSDDVTIGGKPLKAGTYGLHMELHENGKVTVILSNNSTAWGSYFYEPSEDALRVDVQTTEVPHTEQLTYNFINVDWEKNYTFQSTSTSNINNYKNVIKNPPKTHHFLQLCASLATQLTNNMAFRFQIQFS